MALSRRTTVVPAPINILPSQQFMGDDGQWSTFTVSVGTPPQRFRVLPSTKASETWVVAPDGCVATDPTDCFTRRGGENFNGSPSKGFLTNSSSTWNEIGLYSINTESNLGVDANGLFGTDTVGLNGGNGSTTGNGVSLEKQTVGGIASKEFFLGILGLSTAPSSFSSAAKPSQTILQNLLDNNLIPSLSFGYTAGASYGTNGQYNWGSLVLGGYDSTKLKPKNQISLSFASQESRALTVGVQSITATNVNNGTASFTTGSGGFLSLIDSTESQIWLPRAICDQIEGNLGLIYDNATGLYLLNSTQHDSVKAANPTFTFKIGRTAYDNGNSVNIVFPYSAFDLSIGWPTYDRQVNYFPIRRAANESQYTLGRAFLQEAYLTVDYGRNNFSIAPANFADTTVQPHIVAITNNEKKQSGKGGLSAGATAGIVVGAVVLIILAILAFILFRRKRRSPRKDKLSELDGGSGIDTAYAKEGAVHEADGEQVVELPGSDNSAFKNRAELEGPGPIYEMEGDHTLMTDHERNTPSSMDRTLSPFTNDSGRRSTPFSPVSDRYSAAQPSPLSAPDHSPVDHKTL